MSSILFRKYLYHFFLLSIIVLSTIFVLFLCDFLSLRILHYPLYQFNPSFGIQPKANTYYFFRKFPNYKNIISINSDGFRDRERAFAKKTGWRRIIIIGDSFVEACQVSEEDRFTVQLEKYFENDRPVEVIPRALSGVGTAKEYVFLKQYSLQFDPDMVILFIYPQNDLADNIKQLQQDLITSNCSGKLSPSFIEKITQTHLHAVKEGKSIRFLQPCPENSFSFTSTLAFFLLRNSLISRFWYENGQIAIPEDIQNRYTTEQKEKLKSLDLRGIPKSLTEAYFYRMHLWTQPSREKLWKEAEFVFYSLIEMMNNLCTTNGINFLAIIMPANEGNPWPSDEKIHETLSERKIPSIPLTEILASDYAYRDLIILGDGHFNEFGHKKVAEALYKYLVKTSVFKEIDP